MWWAGYWVAQQCGTDRGDAAISQANNRSVLGERQVNQNLNLQHIRKNTPTNLWLYNCRSIGMYSVLQSKISINPLTTWLIFPNICLPGEKMCSACSCSVSVYSKSVSSIYRLTCGHLLCRSCLQWESQPPNSVTISTSNHILCPACQSPTPRSDIVRVHHWQKL